MAKKLPPIYLIGSLFFIFGFVTWLNATLIPYLQIACELNNFQSMLVTFAFYIAYFVLALPSGKILERTGLKNGLSVGLYTMALGAALFIPASMMRSYAMFLSGLFVIGAGLSILQTAANPYVAVIGPSESAARRISIMGICNKLAGGIAPLILGTFILKDVDVIQAQVLQLSGDAKELLLQGLADRARIPYLCIVLVLMILAFAIRHSHLPDVHPEANEDATHKSSIWQHKHLIWGVFALFFYMGAEVVAVDTLISYWSSWGFGMASGTKLPMFGMIALIIGYLIGIILIPKYLSQQKALLFSGLLGLILVGLVLTLEGAWSVYAVVALGLANALVWPAIWGLAITGLGRWTQLGSSLLIMAIAGGATLPLIFGRLADVCSYQQAYAMLWISYLVIGAYAIYMGRRLQKRA